MKKKILILLIPLFFFSCIEVEKEFEVEKELEVVIVEFGDLTSLSDNKQYGNFEIKVAEINGGNDCENLSIICFITACTGLGYSVQRLIKTWVSPSCVPKDRLDFLGKYGVALILLWSAVWGWSLVNVFEIFTSSVLWILIALET